MTTTSQTEISLKKDIDAIKEKLSQIHLDLTHHISTANRLNPDSLFQTAQSNLASTITTYLASEAERDLSEHMIENCRMYKECKSKFEDLLREQASFINRKKVTKQDLREKYRLLEDLKTTAPFKQCTTCFEEAHKLLDRQTHLIKSMNYQETDEELIPIEEIQPHEVVSMIFEPIAHAQRIEILKSLFYEPKTFSQLSNTTGLRGGNLLFHVQKLANAGLITQKHERSNYQITKKGNEALKTIQHLLTKRQTTIKNEP
ncbi:hypothetical protein B6U67_03560 [Methanosarcinales archaeon ex4484_138]|nr:MAG: hypothetical protein B6U67_03560 [Methanosarcinales archaeon ex4484_138]RLG24256.1 MAG: hypothetical protein DRN85_07970 [Methanosarcinales archaeon]